jgi:WD40 repeat protein
LTCIDWHPTKKGVLGVSVCKTMSFDDRVHVSGQVDVAYIIIWEFAEWIKPQLVLQAPHECFTFKFNPTQPDIVVGGTFSGQAIMWNLESAMQEIEKKKAKKVSRDGSADDGEDDHPRGGGIVHPSNLSHIDASHKRMIAELDWLPAETQINYRGQLLAEEHLDGKSYQFVTIAGDGQTLIWDIRYEEIAKGSLPHIFRPKVSLQEKINKDGSVNKTVWKPLFGMNVKRLEGVGELSLCKFLTGLGGADKNEGIDRRSQMIASSDEGELVFADWRAKATSRSSNDNDDAGDEGSDVPEYVQWMAKDHNRPCVALAQSPFFKEMIVSVSDWNFHIWKLDHPKPIFVSPNASTYLTSGRWSPSRPGMLLISKADGCIDVWDFTDSSTRPSAILTTIPSRITSMEFLTGKATTAREQLLAVGDVVGSLHVFDVPRTLWKPVPNERTIMQNFFNREIKRLGFVDKRKEAREEEYIIQSKAEPSSNGNDGGGGGAAAGGGDDNAGAVGGVGSGAAAADDLIQGEDEAMMIKEEEKAYRELEAKFIAQLNLSADDLPDNFDLSKLEIGGK